MDITENPELQRAQHALTREFDRKDELAAVNRSMPKRKTGELNTVYKLAVAAHDSMIYYDKQEVPPAEIFGQTELTYIAAVARLRELNKPKAADDG